MCKEGWCVRLGQEEVVWEGGNCLKYLKGSGTEEGRGNKDFKNGGGGGEEQGQGGDALKRGGLEPHYKL